MRYLSLISFYWQRSIWWNTRPKRIYCEIFNTYIFEVNLHCPNVCVIDMHPIYVLYVGKVQYIICWIYALKSRHWCCLSSLVASVALITTTSGVTYDNKVLAAMQFSVRLYLIMRSLKSSCWLKYPAPHFAHLCGRFPSGPSSCDYSSVPSYWNHCDLFEGWRPIPGVPIPAPIDKCVTWILITHNMVVKDVCIAGCDDKKHEPNSPIFVFHWTIVIWYDNYLNISIHPCNKSWVRFYLTQFSDYTFASLTNFKILFNV